MQHEWVLEVLEDLSNYAKANDLQNIQVGLNAILNSSCEKTGSLHENSTSDTLIENSNVIRFPREPVS